MNCSIKTSLLKPFVALLILSSATGLLAQDTWVGDTDANWSTAANWSPANTPVAGATLLFGAAGTSGASLNYDLANGTVFNGIYFATNGATWTFSGNDIGLNGSIFTTNASAITINNNIDLAANGTVNLRSAGSFTLAGVISDGGNGYGFTKAGFSASVLYLYGANTFTGALNINAGTVAIGALNNLGNGTSIAFGGSSSSTISLSQASGTTVTIPSRTTITVNSGANALFQENTTTANSVFEIAALITGAGGCQQKSSSGASGAAVEFDNYANNYSGNFSMGYGVVEFTSAANGGSASALGAGTTAYAINNSSSFGEFQYLGSGNDTTTRAINWTATTGGLTLDSSGSGSVQYLATSSLRSGSGNVTLTLQGSSTGANTLAQVVNDGSTSGTTAVKKSGAGTWILSGANTFSGGVTLSGGLLNVGGAETPGTSGPLGKSGTISFGGGTLQYSASDTADYSSRFSTAANQAYSVDTAGQNVSFETALTSSGGTLTKTGTGMLTLGGANTYTGNTTINAGTLALAANGSISDSANLNIVAGAVLDVSAVSGGFSLGANRTINGTGATGTINGNLNMGTGSLVLSFVPGTPTLTVTGGVLNMNNNSVTVMVSGNTTLPAGSYQLISPGSGGSVSGSVFFSPLSVNDVGNQAVSLQITNGGLYLVVNPPTVTMHTLTSVTSSLNPSTYGTVPVIFTATVSPAPTNGEVVTFMDGTNSLAAGVLTTGSTAYSTTTLAIGTHLITALYGGDALYFPSSSSVLTQVVSQVAVCYPQGTTFPLFTYEIDNSTYPSLASYGWNIMQEYGLNTNSDVNNFLHELLSKNVAGPAIIPCNGTNDPYTEWSQSQVQAWVQSIAGNINLAWWSLPEEMLPWYPSETNILNDYTAWTRLYDPVQRPTYEYTENTFAATNIARVIPYVDVIGVSCYCEELGMPHAWVRYKLQQAVQGVALAGKTIGSNYLGGQKTLIAVLSIAQFNNSTPSEPSPAQTYHDFWSAIVSGAQGIAVWSYYHALNDDPSNLTNNLNQLNLAASQITGPERIGDVILYGTLNSNVTFKVTSGPTNTVSFTPPEQSTSFQYPSINVLSKTWNGNVYVIAVNSTSNAVTATVSNIPSPAALAALPFESRSVTMTNGSFSDLFPAWGVHIYKMTSTTNLVAPVLNTNVSFGSGSFTFSFSGSSGQTYEVLTSTSLTLPLTNWTVLTNGTFGVNLVYFTDNVATNSQKFYRIASP